MKKVILIFSILILVFVGLIVKEVMDISKTEEFNITYIKIKPCNLQKGSCKFSIPELGSATVSITPIPIKMNKSLEVSIKTNFKYQSSIWIDLLGTEMDMGYNRTKMTNKKNRYTANIFLPTCTADFINWKTTLLIKPNNSKNETTYGIVFNILTTKE